MRFFLGLRKACGSLDRDYCLYILVIHGVGPMKESTYPLLLGSPPCGDPSGVLFRHPVQMLPSGHSFRATPPHHI